MVTIKERLKTTNKYKNHLKWLVLVDGNVVGEHSSKEIADKHKAKIIRMNK